jgi:hypothetical protein
VTEVASDGWWLSSAASAHARKSTERPAGQQLVFIGGSMRSGTTVIHRALCTASNSNNYLSESWFVFEMVMLYYRRLERYDLWMADQLGPPPNFRDLIAQNLEQYFAAVSARSDNPEVLILKHPAVTFAFPLLGEMFPSMKFIVVVRDPRDVIASMKSAREHHVRERVGSVLVSKDTIRKMCSYFMSFYEDVLDWNDPRRRIVRYEDVMRDPRGAIAAIGTFCGGRYDLDRVSTFTDEDAAAPNLDSEQHDRLTRPFWSQLWRKDLSVERIGSYRETLTGQEVAEIEATLRAFGTRFKYWQ